MPLVGPLIRTLASLWLVTVLLAGGPLLNRAWAAGAHGSPEQWMYHLLLTSLGHVDHHQHTADTTPVALTVAGPAVAPMAPSTAVLETLALVGVAGVFLMLCLPGRRRFGEAPIRRPGDRTDGPPEQP